MEPGALRCSACGSEFDFLCPRCDKVVDASEPACPNCGLSFSADDDPPASKAWPAATEEEEEARECPACGEVIYLQDGFCRECGQELCPRCAEAVDEEDAVCPHCGLTLLHSCPLCHFELAVGTEICPNCQALLPNFCVRCGEAVGPTDSRCAQCGAAVEVRKRSGPRLLQTIVVGGKRVPLVACPACSTHFTPFEGRCPECTYRLCPSCQIGLDDEERVCPRCGLAPQTAAKKAQSTLSCPACRRPVQAGSDVCPHCQQWLCPECLSAVAEEDEVCPNCGAVFEFACPQCGATLEPDTPRCSNCGVTF